MLTTEQRNSQAYSKERLKLVPKGCQSREVSPYYPATVPTDPLIAAEEAFDKLACASEEWNTLTKDYSEDDRQKLARDALEKIPKQRKIIKQIDAEGLGLRLDKPFSKLPKKKPATAERDTSSEDNSPLNEIGKVSKAKLPKRSNLLCFARDFPNEVEIFR